MILDTGHYYLVSQNKEYIETNLSQSVELNQINKKPEVIFSEISSLFFGLKIALIFFLIFTFWQNRFSKKNQTSKPNKM